MRTARGRVFDLEQDLREARQLAALDRHERLHACGKRLEISGQRVAKGGVCLAAKRGEERGQVPVGFEALGQLGSSINR